MPAIPNSQDPITLGDRITRSWYRFLYSLSGIVTSQGLVLIPTSAGGTGQTTYNDGQLLIGDSTTHSLDKHVLGAGTGVKVVNGHGTITVEGNYTAGTGLSLTGAEFDLVTPVSVVDGGTGQNVYTDGQLLIGDSTSGGLDLATLTEGTNIVITNSPGSITIATTGLGPGSVTSVDASGGTTGLTFSGGPITSSGTLTLAGTLAATNGGTGATSLGTEFTVSGGEFILATVNPDVGTFQGITVNGKGQVTAAINEGYWVQDADWSFDGSHNLQGNFNATTPPTISFQGSHITGVDANPNPTGVLVDVFGSSAVFTGRRANNTNASPSTLSAGVVVTAFVAQGFDGTAYSGNQALIALISKNAWTSSDHSTQIQFRTTLTGSTTLTLCATLQAGLSVGTATDNGAGTVTANTGFFIGANNILTSKRTLQGTTQNPAGTTSATAVMMGLAGSITPRVNTAVFVSINGSCANGTLADGGTVQVSFGTGSAPANAASLTGTQVGAVQAWSAAVAASKMPFSVSAVLTGLTAGTAYWLDAAVSATTGGTATISGVTVQAFEI